jgi:hypothetical protein
MLQFKEREHTATLREREIVQRRITATESEINVSVYGGSVRERTQKINRAAILAYRLNVVMNSE